MTRRSPNEIKARRARFDFRYSGKRQPTKAEMRDDLARAVANTAKSADLSVALRIEREQRRSGG